MEQKCPKIDMEAVAKERSRYFKNNGKGTQNGTKKTKALAYLGCSSLENGISVKLLLLHANSGRTKFMMN